jgi:hypothetical protein
MEWVIRFDDERENCRNPEIVFGGRESFFIDRRFQWWRRLDNGDSYGVFSGGISKSCWFYYFTYYKRRFDDSVRTSIIGDGFFMNWRWWSYRLWYWWDWRCNIERRNGILRICCRNWWLRGRRSNGIIIIFVFWIGIVRGKWRRWDWVLYDWDRRCRLRLRLRLRVREIDRWYRNSGYGDIVNTVNFEFGLKIGNIEDELWKKDILFEYNISWDENSIIIRIE